MSYETVTTRVAEILNRIENVYNVHQYLRDIPDDAEFEKAFTVALDDKTIMTAWMMTRTAIAAERPTFDVTNTFDVTHRIEIQGFYGLSDADASEREFQTIIDSIYNKFRTKYLLEDEAGVALAGVLLVAPIQTLEIGHGQFSNYFVHFCRMLLSVEERLQ